MLGGSVQGSFWPSKEISTDVSTSGSVYENLERCEILLLYIFYDRPPIRRQAVVKLAVIRALRDREPTSTDDPEARALVRGRSGRGPGGSGSHTTAGVGFQGIFICQ